jgi:hypothetical protein
LKLFDSQRFSALATLIEVVLWGTVMAAIGGLIWRYRDGLQAFFSRRPRPREKAARPLPQQAFGLDLSPDTPPRHRRQRRKPLANPPREALGLLYRALLSHLLHDFNIALKAADTEGQVLERVEQLQQPALSAYSRNLTGHWQNMAYGHRPPPAHVRQQLCDGWRSLFGPEAVH